MNVFLKRESGDEHDVEAAGSDLAVKLSFIRYYTGRVFSKTNVQSIDPDSSGSVISNFTARFLSQL